jgi:hypothetical protein
MTKDKLTTLQQISLPGAGWEVVCPAPCLSPSSSPVRTPPFHGENRGSNPRGDAIRRRPDFCRGYGEMSAASAVRTPEGFDGVPRSGT